MKLKGFSLYGLFGEYDYNINLNDGYITFIHSLNGYGKSTIMKLIFDILTGNIDELKDVNFDRMDLRFDNDTSLIVERTDEVVLIKIQKNEIIEDISVDDLSTMLNAVYISPERSVVSCDRNLRPALDQYMSELTKSLRSAKENNQLINIPKKGRKEYSDAELEFWCKDLKAKLDFIKRAGIEPEMPAGYRFPPSRFEIMEYRKDYEDLAFSIEEYVERNYLLSESTIVYIDIINDLLINKSIYINESNILSVRMDNGTALPLNKVSSGEKQILIMFYIILFDTTEGSLVIIDEPEISLHVAWQHSLGKIFIDIAKLRDLRMIISTHSPQVIHDKWDMSVELKAENK